MLLDVQRHSFQKHDWFFTIFKVYENRENSSCPNNSRKTGLVHAKNTSGLRRLKCSLVNTVNLKRKLLVCGFTATDFAMRSEVDQ